MPQLDRAKLCGEEGPVLVTSDIGGAALLRCFPIELSKHRKFGP